MGSALLPAYQTDALTALRQTRSVFLVSHLSSRRSSNLDPSMISRYLAGLLLGLTATANAADTSSCYAIAEADARTYCLALAHNDPGRCYAIQDSAMRSRCLAEVRQ